MSDLYGVAGNLPSSGEFGGDKDFGCEREVDAQQDVEAAGTVFGDHDALAEVGDHAGHEKVGDFVIVDNEDV
ncbi:hypothetical protein HDV00_002467 [Rhizophlyctis rosea]|nr:hypothetical protein HDV00_002467 [Rhizophlyctis rosea]